MCEIPSCYGHEERTARKAHKCCECHGTIQVGEKYHFHHNDDWRGLCQLLLLKRSVDGLNGRPWDAGRHLEYETLIAKTLSVMGFSDAPAE
jgi:hypothetical protein